jgi:hypothetical protein
VIANEGFPDSPFQPVRRDITTISGHIGFELEAIHILDGKVELDLTTW